MFLPPKDFVRSSEAQAHTYTQTKSEEYTRWLAVHHYENFHVVTFVLPRRLHQDFYNVYAFCRWADDLGDEIGDSAESLRVMPQSPGVPRGISFSLSRAVVENGPDKLKHIPHGDEHPPETEALRLRLLGWWRQELEAMYQGRATHPVFVALRGTVERHALPKEPFADLIRAFVQDQTVTRYRSYDEVFEYCRYSANPVGRLVLYLCGYRDGERQRLSDATCTALQLANFWQDVAVDLEKGRVYIPLEALERHGYPLEDLLARRVTPAFRAVMKELVEVARSRFLEGLPLARMVDRRLGVDIELFSRGGLRILEKIERQNYDVLGRRPAISRRERAWLLLGALARRAFARAA